MPSGPKKRKAAKKKNQNENIIKKLQGNDELKSKDKIGSDGGEVSSARHGTSNDESVTKNYPKGEDYNSIEDYNFIGNSVAESCVNSVKAMASLSLSENDDNGSVLVEKKVVPSVGVTDIAMKINEDRVYPLIDESARTSNFEEPKPKECDSKVLASFSASPFTKSVNDAEHIKETENPECSENQPLVAQAPHIVQKTSWLSCCGLYEVVSGSDR